MFKVRSIYRNRQHNIVAIQCLWRKKLAKRKLRRLKKVHMCSTLVVHFHCRVVIFSAYCCAIGLTVSPQVVPVIIIIQICLVGC